MLLSTYFIAEFDSPVASKILWLSAVSQRISLIEIFLGFSRAHWRQIIVFGVMRIKVTIDTEQKHDIRWIYDHAKCLASCTLPLRTNRINSIETWAHHSVFTKHSKSKHRNIFAKRTISIDSNNELIISNCKMAFQVGFNHFSCIYSSFIGIFSHSNAFDLRTSVLIIILSHIYRKSYEL